MLKHIVVVRQDNALRLRDICTRSRRSVKYAGSSLKRFETTGMGSLQLVLKVAHALSRLEEFNNLFQPPPAASIEELERRAARPVPKRGRI